MKLYAVYTQYYPDYEHEPTLESIWTDKEAAIAEAKTFTKEDYVWVTPIYANSVSLHSGDFDDVKDHHIIKSL